MQPWSNGKETNTSSLLLYFSPSQTLQGTNTYLIGTGRKRLLLDAGEANNVKYIKNLKEIVQKEDCYIEKIVITHWHQGKICGECSVR